MFLVRREAFVVVGLGLEWFCRRPRALGGARRWIVKPYVFGYQVGCLGGLGGLWVHKLRRTSGLLAVEDGESRAWQARRRS